MSKSRVDKGQAIRASHTEAVTFGNREDGQNDDMSRPEMARVIRGGV